MAGPGERLRTWIEERGLTQAEASDLIGCSRVFVTLLISGRRTLRDLNIALAIERETTTWEKGPIEVREWGVAPAEPEPGPPDEEPLEATGTEG